MKKSYSLDEKCLELAAYFYTQTGDALARQSEDSLR